ncbi:hypothetical protein Lepto7375DRAFT_0792 [Leptolyngbya sp. PCC 7375]|nr:hypothetical protein Lepto7375DRAFT_0792 [Leptolyngbya sp. PCC 7375]
MTDSYDLSQLDPNAFEHLVNHLALKVLGPGLTVFGPGADGGRDGYFQGEAPYPSETERWSGCWYIQSKFHKPKLSKDPQKWLISKIKEELRAFKSPNSRREWPDNWIIATNIDPSGAPETGSFDKARALIEKEYPPLKERFHIWGGNKILQLLSFYPEVREEYQHFLTPGNVLAELYGQLQDNRAEVKSILRFLVLSQLDEHQYTKLEQAGSASDTRPGIQDLFIDLPFRCDEYKLQGMVVEWLVKTLAKCHRFDDNEPDTPEWRAWSKFPARAKVWFIKGGPGHGKSTISQFICQIQRAALITNKNVKYVSPKRKSLANEIKQKVIKLNFWPTIPRVPISIELREFAQWFGQQGTNKPRGILSYLANFISIGLEQKVSVGTLKRLLGKHRWLVIFDGLDEVPQDVKDEVAFEVCRFVNDISISIDADLLTICTSRPQGYSGQFENLDGPTIELVNLSKDQALRCAEPVLKLDRASTDFKKSIQILENSIESEAVRELMTTPLQSHIMAVVVRDGERPPERKWKLFTNFYQVIKRREANRNLPDKKISELLRTQEKLLKTVHNRLGFALHARAESSKGAQTKLDRNEFKELIENAVSQLIETNVDATVNTLMKATTDRLVLVSTPDDGDHVRFDIRPLQEFFAAEFLYESVTAEQLRERIQLISGDAHWREVMHFLLSALIENDSQTELSVAISILENLNEGDDDDNLHILRRRLARGASPAARLLQEGVLEQDKRIRQQFRKCFEPLAASTKLNLLEPLLSVNQVNSRLWLHNFLFSCLRDKSPTESIGAAIVLLKTLPDGHDRVEDFTIFLLASPSDYFSHIFSEGTNKRDFITGTSKLFTRQWIYNLIIRKLLTNDWLKLKRDAMQVILEFLSRFSAKLPNQSELVKDFRLSELESKLLSIVFIKYLPSKRKKSRDVLYSQKDYGFIRIDYHKNTWVDKLSPNVVDQDLAQSPTIIQIVQWIACAIKKNSPSHLVKVMTVFKEQKSDLLITLFSQLGVSFLIDAEKTIDENIQDLQGLTTLDFQEHINLDNRIRYRTTVKAVGAHASVNIFSEENLNNWKELLKDYPEIAFFLWMQGEHYHINETPLFDELVQKVIEKPKILSSFPSSWGNFLKEAPDRETDLRTAFLKASANKVSDQGSVGGIEPFRINLPKEAPLLPHILNTFLSYRIKAPRNREIDKELAYIQKTITAFCPNCSELENIFKDTNITPGIQAAAAMALLLHPDSNRSLNNLKQPIVDFFKEDLGSWYTNVVISCLRFLSTEEDKNACWIMNHVLDNYRDNYDQRRCIQELLSHWREISYAPIQKAKVQNKWLTQTQVIRGIYT